MNEGSNLSALGESTSLSNSCKSMGDVKEENLSSLVMNTSLSTLGIKRRKVKWLKKSYRQQAGTSSENSLREVWNEEAIDVKTKCIITVVSLMASGITDSSLTYHLQNAKAHGVTKEEIAAIITHATMYVGWPKGWAVFRLAKEVWNEEEHALTDKDRYQNTIFFPVGNPNPYGEFFVGQSYLAPISTDQVPIFNVTFEPGCRNNWHIHHAKSGGGQMLICVGGRGYYQEWGKEPVEMTPGTVINIPSNVKHWHGAAPDSWFSHLAIEVEGEETGTEWLEAVETEDYRKLK